MKALALVASTLAAALAIAPVTLAKRAAPQPVEPVLHDGVRYEAPVEKMGFVEAFDVVSGKKLWTLQVYRIEVDPSRERDVQDVYITKLEIVEGGLLVTDERDREYLVDLTTHAVHRR
jgi:hypothetical protein